jgi:hypothetical protein
MKARSLKRPFAPAEGLGHRGRHPGPVRRRGVIVRTGAVLLRKHLVLFGAQAVYQHTGDAELDVHLIMPSLWLS